jgi:acyl-CoA dehydrogenase
VGFAISNALRSLWMGLTGARLTTAPVSGSVKRCYQQLNRMSAAFALVSDVSLLVLGGELKRREKLSGRLADVLSYLYLASAALKRFEDQARPHDDLPLLHWVCDYALYEMQHSINGLLKNFPNRPAAWLMRLLVFPLGKPYGGPSDYLGHQCADLLLSPSDTRDRLTRGIYTPSDPKQALGRLERALNLQIDTAPIDKKIRTALKSGELNRGTVHEQFEQAHKLSIIDNKEYALLLEASEATRDAIMVDEFDKEALMCHTNIQSVE